jgi:hypothetical protein
MNRAGNLSSWQPKRLVTIPRCGEGLMIIVTTDLRGHEFGK